MGTEQAGRALLRKLREEGPDRAQRRLVLLHLRPAGPQLRDLQEVVDKEQEGLLAAAQAGEHDARRARHRLRRGGPRDQTEGASAPSEATSWRRVKGLKSTGAA